MLKRGLLIEKHKDAIIFINLCALESWFFCLDPSLYTKKYNNMIRTKRAGRIG